MVGESRTAIVTDRWAACCPPCPSLLQTDEFAVRADEALIGWVAKQHTHFADLLLPQAEAAVAAMLEGRAAAGGSRTLSLSERKEMLQVLRQLAAVVQPDRCALGDLTALHFVLTQRSANSGNQRASRCVSAAGLDSCAVCSSVW